MKIDTTIVQHMSSLANIPVSKAEEQKLAEGFTTTLQVVDKLKKIDTTTVKETSQVTDYVNRFRDDVVDKSRMIPFHLLSKNAPRTYNTFIVVDQIREEK